MLSTCLQLSNNQMVLPIVLFLHAPTFASTHTFLHASDTQHPPLPISASSQNENSPLFLKIISQNIPMLFISAIISGHLPNVVHLVPLTTPISDVASLTLLVCLSVKRHMCSCHDQICTMYPHSYPHYSELYHYSSHHGFLSLIELNLKSLLLAPPLGGQG